MAGKPTINLFLYRVVQQFLILKLAQILGDRLLSSKYLLSLFSLKQKWLFLYSFLLKETTEQK
jgi:hypothetical protein